ncbi:protein serine/threonine phosphatase 2C, partial [Meredithblackwellia eburnea MCA 4105]
HHHHHHHAGVSSVGVGKHAFHSSAYSAHQIQPQASSASIHSPPPPPPSAIGVDSGPGVLSLSSHHHHNQNPSQSPFTSNPSSSSSSTTTSSSSSSLVSSSTQPTSQPSSSNSTTTSDRATLFTSHTPASFPNHPLPSFFGTSLNIARRSNLVFRNGAYGIPKAKVGGESNKKNAATAAAAAAAAAKGKGKEVDSGIKDEPEHALSVGVGEDAYFLRTDSLGVADGVGGWSGHAGANPARWSRKFMHHCSSELARYENVEDELFLQYYEVDPVEVLQRAFEKTLAECKEEGVIGSSTALIAVLRNDELRLANMGDCCCSIIRGNDYVFRSEEQQHSFNYPFQAGTTSKDTPIKDAQRFTIKVQKDDIVILSSDGLCDNLFTDDVLEEVLRFVAESPPPTIPVTGSAHPGSRYQLNRFSPQAVSEALCHRAKSVYEDQRAVSSPFALRAMEEGIHFAGGKRDDITTLIGVVGE